MATQLRMHFFKRDLQNYNFLKTKWHAKFKLEDQWSSSSSDYHHHQQCTTITIINHESTFNCITTGVIVISVIHGIWKIYQIPITIIQDHLKNCDWLVMKSYYKQQYRSYWWVVLRAKPKRNRFAQHKVPVKKPVHRGLKSGWAKHPHYI